MFDIQVRYLGSALVFRILQYTTVIKAVN